MPPPPLPYRLRSYTSSFMWYFYAIYNNLATLVSSPALVLSLSTFRRAAYARLWLTQGARMAEILPGDTLSLLHGVSGRVLEIGAGSGEMLQFYDREKVEQIWGVEPASDLLPKLQARGNHFFGEEDAEVWNGRYRVLNCGAEMRHLVPQLWKARVLSDDLTAVDEGVFDTVVCVRVLCMVSDFEDTIRGFFSLLRPGGRLVVCEHGINQWRTRQVRYGCGEDLRDEEGSFMARAIQYVLSRLGWTFWMGDCHLERDMESALRAAGNWRGVTLQTVDAWSVLPYTVGELIK